MLQNLVRRAVIIPFVLALLSFAVIGYFWLRCLMTDAGFYCEAFEFGAIIFFFGIPALALLLIAILGIFLRKRMAEVILLSLAMAIFLLPWIFALGGAAMNPDRPFTYRAWLEERGGREYEIMLQKQKECSDYIVYLRNRQEGQALRTPPIGCEDPSY